MENPLSVCYSNVKHTLYYFFFLWFPILVMSEHIKQNWKRERGREGKWTKNLYIHEDYREIHLKKSFFFYWFHINVSFGMNKSPVAAKKMMEKCWCIQAIIAKVNFNANEISIHIRCTFHESIFLILYCCSLSFACTIAHVLHIPHIAKWTYICVNTKSTVHDTHYTNTNRNRNPYIYIRIHLWATPSVRKQNSILGSLDCRIFEF